MEDLYTRKMSQETVQNIYEGLKNAFNSVADLYIDTPKIKGKMWGDYLITERNEGYSVFDTMFSYIKNQIVQNEKVMTKPIFQHIPLNKVFDLIAQEENNPLPPEAQKEAAKWVLMYTNHNYNLGLGSTSSLFALDRLITALSDKGFMKPISKEEILSWSDTNVYQFGSILEWTNKLFDAATENKYTFNDGDNAIYLKNKALVIATQSYGYYIEKEHDNMTFYVYAENSKKHDNLNALIKGLKTESLIDNVALKVEGEKAVFGDALFTHTNLLEDLGIAARELPNMKPKTTKKM